MNIQFRRCSWKKMSHDIVRFFNLLRTVQIVGISFDFLEYIISYVNYNFILNCSQE